MDKLSTQMLSPCDISEVQIRRPLRLPVPVPVPVPVPLIDC